MSQTSVNNSEQIEEKINELTLTEQEIVPAPTTSTTNKSTENEDDGLLTLRALVSTKEAGVIIGKGKLNTIYCRNEKA